MNILNKIEVMAKGNERNIGIGLGKSEFHNSKIIQAISEFLQEKSAKIFIFGNKDSLSHIQNNISLSLKSNFQFIQSDKAEQDIFKYLIKKRIDSIIRGSMSSSKFLKELKKTLNPKVINRIALLETIHGHQFFYGPVGIDECNDVKSKIEFIENALKQLELFNIIPIISVLSGGRVGDIGRNREVDRSIQDAQQTVTEIKKHHPSLNIKHDEILIENAIKNKSNLIIAPDGISGNLIYRTLVHLGGGKAYGAIYMNLENLIIDTSRVGDISEIQGALLLALAL
ncbi:MAG: methanogenesis marker protein Mmp4/MtxX [Promethearchaeota archaeon]